MRESGDSAPTPLATGVKPLPAGQAAAGPVPAWWGPLYATLLGLWVGAQAAVGFLVAPTLFALLPDRSLAGTVAGALFERLGWLALGVIAILLLARRQLDRASPGPHARGAGRLLACAWILTATGHFVLRPWIAAVRQQIQAGGGFAHGDSALLARFGVLHGASSLLFLLVTLCGLALLWRQRASNGA